MRSTTGTGHHDPVSNFRSLLLNALLKANTVNEWSPNGSSLLNASNLSDVTITGGGAVDGGGLVYPRGTYSLPRPGHGIRFTNCTRMTVRNVTVRNIPTFAVDFTNSSEIIADSVIIRGRGFANLKGSSDGMDIQGSHHVTVTRCDIEVGDDALCLKANDTAHPVHDIVMRDNTLASTCNAWKIGTNTKGETYNILAENINCLKAVTQPIIFNWQCGMANKMQAITLSNITVHAFGTKAGGKRRKFHFDASVRNVDSSAINDYAVGLSGRPEKRAVLHSPDFTRKAFDAWGRSLSGQTDAPAAGMLFRKDSGLP